MLGLAAYSRGKVRIGAIALVSVVAFALLAFIFFSAAPRAYSDPPGPTLFVTNSYGDASTVTAYPAASNGGVLPLDPAPPGLDGPRGMAIDSNGNLYVPNVFNATVSIYGAASNGSVAPIAVIGGTNTGLINPEGVALDSSGTIYGGG